MTKETPLGKYLLLEQLGRGGYGTVYRAHDRVLKVERAVKVLHPALVADPEFLERFRREAQLAARLEHAHIVPVYDLGEEKGSVFLAMKFMEGGSLKDLLAKEGQLSFERAVEITGQIARALDYSHGQPEHLVHRDVKPGNILFEVDGTARLADFGFAKALQGAGSASLSASGAMIGTPAYMAPEIWLGQEATPQTDVYSLGCLVYEMLTGQSLFGGGDSPPPLVMKRHFDPLVLPEPWPAGMPAGITEVLQMALAKKPGDRYQSIADFAAALKSVLSGIAAPARPQLASPRERTLDTQTTVNQMEESIIKERSEPRTPSTQTVAPSSSSGLLRYWPIALVGGLIIIGGLAIALIFALAGGGAVPVTPAPPIVTEAPVATEPPVVSEAPVATKLPVATEASALGVGSTWVRPADGMVMMYVPEGDFTMGSPDNVGDSDEHPQHKVSLDAFWIDRSEVTNTMFAAFLNEKGNQSEGGVTWLDAGDSDVLIVQSGSTWQPKSGYADHPVIEVSWYGAQAYCAWAGADTRLPTEAEWEKAARGGLEGKLYPWGDQAPTCQAGATNGAQYTSCSSETVAVMTFSPNGYGLYDMAGNVWEWVNDWYGETYYTSSPSSNPQGPSTGQYRLLRGGSWYYDEDTVRTANRDGDGPVSTNYGFGFRCARSH